MSQIKRVKRSNNKELERMKVKLGDEWHKEVRCKGLEGEEKNEERKIVSTQKKMMTDRAGIFLQYREGKTEKSKNEPL